MEYDYVCNIMFVYDIMTIFHRTYYITQEFYDVDDPILEDNIVNLAHDDILNEYGFDVLELKPIDIVIEWEDFPMEEYKDPFMDENGD